MELLPDPDSDTTDIAGEGLSVGDPILGKSRLLSRQCDTCVFAPGNKMHLAPGRLRDLVAEARSRDPSSSATPRSPITSTLKPSRRSAAASPTGTRPKRCNSLTVSLASSRSTRRSKPARSPADTAARTDAIGRPAPSAFPWSSATT